MPCCSAVGCPTRHGCGKKMHRFPRDRGLRKKWEENLRRPYWSAHDNAFLCSDHFDETQYELKRADNLRKLKPFAVPTIFPAVKIPQGRKRGKREVADAPRPAKRLRGRPRRRKVVIDEEAEEVQVDTNGVKRGQDEGSDEDGCVSTKLMEPIVEVTEMDGANNDNQNWPSQTTVPPTSHTSATSLSTPPTRHHGNPHACRPSATSAVTPPIPRHAGTPSFTRPIVSHPPSRPVVPTPPKFPSPPPAPQQDDPLKSEWVWFGGTFLPHAPMFDLNNAGIQDFYRIREESREIDLFQVFFDEGMMSHIVQATNKKVNNFPRKVRMSERSKKRMWVDTDVAELYTFLALVMLMPTIRKHAVRDYWTQDPIINPKNYGHYMTRDRFHLLLRCLNFVDCQTDDDDADLYQMEQVMSHLREKFHSVFKPYQNLVISESCILFEGQLNIRQYIKSKRQFFDNRVFVICDCQTGYVLDMLLYTVKDTEVHENEPLGAPGAIVKKLMHRYLGQGHVLYTDKWCTSPALCKDLLEHNTGACGKVMGNRRYMPKYLPKLKPGECCSVQSNKILVQKWHYHRDVYYLTTVHEGRMIETGKNKKIKESIAKPDSAIDFAKNLHLIDNADKMIASGECLNKFIKWYIKLFLHMVDISVLNAYKLFIIKSGKECSMVDFVFVLTRQILEKYSGKSCLRGVSLPLPNNDRLTARHFCEKIPPNEDKRFPLRHCYVCLNTMRRPQKRKDTRYYCPDCGVGLCFQNCFRDYHTVKNF